MRRLLQILTGIEAAIAVLAGGIVLVHGGPDALHLLGNHHLDGVSAEELAAIDFAMRAGAALTVMLGLAFASTIRDIERKTPLFRLACAALVAMAIGRLLSVAGFGAPNGGEWLAIGLELGFAVVLVLIQARVAAGAAV